jgi:hypothetical protein
MSPSTTLILKISIGLFLFSLVAYIGWRLEKSHKENTIQEVTITVDEENQDSLDKAE